MRKPDFCLCENKGADQLRSNRSYNNLSMLKILECMYFCTVMLSTQYSIGAYQTFNVTRVELIRIRHIPETHRALSMLHA